MTTNDDRSGCISRASSKVEAIVLKVPKPYLKHAASFRGAAEPDRLSGSTSPVPAGGEKPESPTPLQCDPLVPKKTDSVASAKKERPKLKLTTRRSGHHRERSPPALDKGSPTSSPAPRPKASQSAAKYGHMSFPRERRDLPPRLADSPPRVRGGADDILSAHSKDQGLLDDFISMQPEYVNSPVRRAGAKSKPAARDLSPTDFSATSGALQMVRSARRSRSRTSRGGRMHDDEQDALSKLKVTLFVLASRC